MIVNREISNQLLLLSEKYPVITITGPRQSGKTTLCREVFKDKKYFNLEIPDIREYAIQDPRGFLSNMPDGGIIDEIQRVPKLVSYIQGIVDEKKINGQFILTGSQQFEISNAISQSLAGRTGLLKLLPFSLTEVANYKGDFTANELIYKGFYPRIYDQDINPTSAYANYFETYVERDLRQLVQIKNLSMFQKFVRMCAARTGQLLNLNNLSNDLGISHTTAREWITLLEASYIIFLLEPFFSNVKKRLIKAPKIYFYDTGFASYLLGIENLTHLENHPLRGSLFENMVAIEILKYRYNRGERNNLNFYRDSTGNEVDIIYNVGSGLLLLEIKAGKTVAFNYFDGINAFKKVIPELLYGAVVLYDGIHRETRGDIKIEPFKNVTRILDSIK